MIVVLSGEGPTDFGFCAPHLSTCEGGSFSPGPFTHIIDRVLAGYLEYSPLECNNCILITRAELLAIGASIRRVPAKRLSLPGHGLERGCVYFTKNAHALAFAAKRIAQERQTTDVIAVLFRDADGSNSAPRLAWVEKYESVIKGFALGDFPNGIPMIPKPIGEAWLIAGYKRLSRLSAESLESRTPSESSPHSIKRELDEILANTFSGSVGVKTELMCRLLSEGHVDIGSILSPSFMRFLRDVDRVITRFGLTSQFA